MFFQKTSSFTTRAILVAGCLLFAVAFISSFFTAFAVFGSAITLIVGVVTVFILLVAASSFINRYLSKKWFLISLIAVSLLTRITWVLAFNTPPASDFSKMYTAAVSAAAGDFSFNDSEYFSAWVYQMGFTMYEALIVKLFDHPILVLKLIHVVFSVGTILLIYAAASAIFNEKCGRIASLLYAFYIPNIIMCSVLTNQHLSTFFFMLGCVLILHKDWDVKYRWILIGLSFGIGHIMRPLGGVFIAALVAYTLIIELLPSINKKVWSISAKLIGSIIAFYLLQTLVSSAFMSAGYTEHPLSNREPYWKFMVGLNAETDGRWSREDAKYVLQYKLGEERDQAELAIIKERLSDPSAVVTLIAKKFYVFWGATDDSVYWSLSELNRPYLSSTLQSMERIMFILMSGFGIFSLIALFRKGLKQPQSLFFVILLLGYTAIHLIIEIQSRYRLDVIPAFIVLQSYGIYMISDYVQRLFNSKHKQIPMQM